jgi:hypothetical protein
MADEARGGTVHGWFRQAGASVLFTTSESRCLADAISTLYAYRTDEPPAGDTGCWHVSVHVDPRLPAPTVRECLRAGTIQETGPQLSAHVIIGQKRITAWVPGNTSLIEADSVARTVRVRCLAPDVALHWGARLIRQVITAELVRRGAVYAHGAALDYHGAGVLILGPRGAGKTTTLLSVLHYIGGAYVSNDRLLISRNRTGGGIEALPWPTHLRAGTGTLRALPELTVRLPECLRSRPADQAAGGQKIRIDPAWFSHLGRDGTVGRECRPALMIWPELRLGARATMAEPVRPADVSRTLTRTRMFMHDPATGSQSRVNHWLTGLPPVGQADENLRAAAASLASEVPCYRLLAGPDTEDLARCVAGVLRNLTEEDPSAIVPGHDSGADRAAGHLRPRTAAPGDRRA